MIPDAVEVRLRPEESWCLRLGCGRRRRIGGTFFAPGSCRWRRPCASLVDHFLRLVNARDMPGCRRLRKALNNHSRAEAHFQHSVIWFDLEEVADPGAAIGVRAGHDGTAQPPKEALRSAKRPRQNESADTRDSLWAREN
jgi:hypothetical protein